MRQSTQHCALEIEAGRYHTPARSSFPFVSSLFERVNAVSQTRASEASVAAGLGEFAKAAVLNSLSGDLCLHEKISSNRVAGDALVFRTGPGIVALLFLRMQLISVTRRGVDVGKRHA